MSYHTNIIYVITHKQGIISHHTHMELCHITPTGNYTISHQQGTISSHQKKKTFYLAIFKHIYSTYPFVGLRYFQRKMLLLSKFNFELLFYARRKKIALQRMEKSCLQIQYYSTHHTHKFDVRENITISVL